jgi:hypothetical protein
MHDVARVGETIVVAFQEVGVGDDLVVLASASAIGPRRPEQQRGGLTRSGNHALAEYTDPVFLRQLTQWQMQKLISLPVVLNVIFLHRHAPVRSNESPIVRLLLDVAGWAAFPS